MTQPRPREDTRIVVPIAMLLKIGDETEGCFSRNISRGGVFVVTPKKPTAGSIVEVSLTHQKNKLTCSAEVMNIREEGLGLRFVDKSPEFCEGLDALIQGLVTSRGGHVAARAVSKSVQAGAAWAYPLGDQDTETWQKTICPATLLGLSLDGAAMQAKRAPAVGETILFFLTTPNEPNKAHHTYAEVARHIEGGFAIKYIKPSIELRRTISELRRGGPSPSPE